jgi:hypothetical protein
LNFVCFFCHFDGIEFESWHSFILHSLCQNIASMTSHFYLKLVLYVISSGIGPIIYAM